MAEEANTAPEAETTEVKPAPKSPYDKYADFINTQKPNDVFGKSSGPVSNDTIARATGKLPHG